MAILVNNSTNVLVQGITGNEGSRATKNMQAYGTIVSCGVTPGKGGATIHETPVYDTVRNAIQHHPGVNTSVIYVPPFAAQDAAIEAIKNGIELVVIITENIPVHETAEIITLAEQHNTTVVGPSSIGVISPDKAKVGSIGGNDNKQYTQGNIGIVSKSGGMSSETAMLLKQHGYGVSTVVGIGGDVISGTNFVDTLRRFEHDSETHAVVLYGEIGGAYEEHAASYIIDEMTTPVVAFISGKFANKFQYVKLGHAGAIVRGNSGSRASKVQALKRANVPIADVHHELPTKLEEVL